MIILRIYFNTHNFRYNFRQFVTALIILVTQLDTNRMLAYIYSKGHEIILSNNSSLNSAICQNFRVILYYQYNII